MELNKIYSVIFKFFYDLLRVYKFSADQFYTKKHRHASPAKIYNKIYDIFCLPHGSTYVKLNKICFVIFRFFYELLCIYQFSADLNNKIKLN